MKKLIAISLIATVAFNTLLADTEKEIKGTVSQVTVYPDRAQLSVESSVEISPGKSVLRLKGLSPYIDPQSIQVKGTGEFTILSVNHQNNYLQNLEDQPEVKAIRAQIESLQLKTEDEKAALQVLEEKYTFLNSNRLVLPKESGMTPDQYRIMFEMYSSNIELISVSKLKRQRQVKEYEKQIAALQQQVAGLLGRDRMPSGEIAVTVNADKPVSGKLTSTFIVSNAGWYPSYDIRVEDISKPVVIQTKANVFQNTGSDWKNVKLSFSNATPWVAGNVPLLETWFIDFSYPMPMNRALSGRAAGVRAKSEEAPVMLQEVLADKETVLKAPEASMAYVEKRVGEMSVTYEVALPNTIASDGKVQTIELQKSSSPAEYKYVTVPKLAARAYLTGNISDWTKQNLMPGEANLYFENTFVGKSYIDVSQMSDTLSLSLGTDNNITVKREKRKDFTSRKVIGTNKTETFSFLISVRNNKTSSVKLTVNDQVPVSANSSITVEVTELSGGKHDIATGKVRWDLEVKPQEKKDFVLTYTVKYPKTQVVILE